jgi:hypothetical protein
LLNSFARLEGDEQMNGVEILSSTVVVTETTSNLWLAGTVWILVIVACGVIGYISSEHDKCEATLTGCLVGAFLGILLWLAINAITSTPVAQEVQYEITIDDSVSMTELTNKYEIIEQRGKIYVVREKVE